MKKIMFVALCLAFSFSLSAQDKEDQKKITYGKLSQADRLVADVFTDMWIMKGAASDSIDTKQINRGANVYVMKEFPFGTSNFSFAVGLGVSCHNIYSDAMPIKNYTLDSLGAKVFDGTTVFKKIPSKLPDGSQDIHYKNNKFTVVYADIPLEFRFRLKNNAFKFYLGGKFGLMLGNHTKYSGDDFTEAYPTPTIKIKEYKIDNVNKVRYGITLRTGWKWIQVYGYYSLSHLFKKDKGPDMYPISVGLTISPY
ncbi:MAG TPA: porin family protein [Bacteroidales bacterium]|nr:porin family protein [Bacteroidales bacterium]